MTATAPPRPGVYREGQITRERDELEASIDELERGGATIPCRSGTPAQTAYWTSEYDYEQDAAAEMCSPCPAKAACALFGLRWPAEEGVYGGITAEERRRPALAAHHRKERARHRAKQRLRGEHAEEYDALYAAADGNRDGRRSYAFNRLAASYPHRYRELFEQERAR